MSIRKRTKSLVSVLLKMVISQCNVLCPESCCEKSYESQDFETQSCSIGCGDPVEEMRCG